MHAVSTENLIQKSNWLRKQLLELVVRTQKGHIPSCFSCAEIVVSLFYGGYLNYNAENPDDENRDRILISKGHAAMVLYPILADLGFFSASELESFCKPDGLLRMYADNSIPGIESITGSLGHGLGIAAGYALRAKRDHKDFKSFVVIGDGECYEGSIWETALFASSYNLDNLVVIVDRNKLCIMDETENCVKLDDLAKKWDAFGWETYEVDGHSYASILPVMDKIKRSTTGKPKAIISQSIKGKGISFMEGQALWHNRMMNDEQVIAARKELDLGCITS
tara:strand:- start:523 stop:1362 length:840 start_codon:yes stop_codon:yes gene_type:complete